MKKSHMDTWRTQDGRTLQIEKMSSGHIKNCIRMIENNTKRTKKSELYIKSFKHQLRKRTSSVYRVLNG